MIAINNVEIKNRNFPAGELSMEMNSAEWRRDDKDIEIEWYYENDAELFKLICITRFIRDFYSSYASYTLSLYLPYVPHSRMDRVKDYKDVFTLKYFAEVINGLGFDIVLYNEAHSDVMPALINNAKSYTTMDYTEVLNNETNLNDAVVFFPDAGALKRYSHLCDRNYTFGVKNRIWGKNNITEYTIVSPEVVTGKDVFIVDDICSKGTTFVEAAKQLREAGANKIYLFVSYLESNVLNGDLLNIVEKIYTPYPYLGENAMNWWRDNEKIEIVGFDHPNIEAP